jgi:hypothetical protein
MSDERPEMRTVAWRLPVRVASDNGGDWSAFREHLEAWAESEDRMDAEAPEETTHVSFRMPARVLAKLEKEAERLAKKTGRKWTAGRVARLVWDEWEPDG